MDRIRLANCLIPLYMATNFANAIDHMSQTATGNRLWSVLSSAIVNWYYAIYYLFQGFFASIDGTVILTHAQARDVLNDASKRRYLLPPFSVRAVWGGKWNSPALEPPTWPRNSTFLRNLSTTQQEAQSAVGAYLGGTWIWFALEIMARVRRQHGLTDFRPKPARQLRDAALNPLGANFLHSMYRYRTKANYRDAIFTTYGAQFTGQPTAFLTDLLTVYQALSLNLESFVCRRIHINRYQRYIDNVGRHQRDPNALFPTRAQGPPILSGMA